MVLMPKLGSLPQLKNAPESSLLILETTDITRMAKVSLFQAEISPAPEIWESFRIQGISESSAEIRGYFHSHA